MENERRRPRRCSCILEVEVLPTTELMSTQGATGLADHYGTRRTPSTVAMVQAAIIGGLILWLCGAVLVDMAHDWWIEPAWSQGMLLPPLVMYIAWMGRKRTFSVPAVPDARGLLVLAAGCASLVLGKLASEFFLMRISFVLFLAGLTWTFWGRARLRTLAFPLLLLATMVPLPVMVYNTLAAPLQLLASDLATRAAQSVGISVFRDGNIIELAGTSLGVAEACSGLNSLSALMVGSLLLGYLVCDRILSRLLLFLVAPALAILVNIVRVAGTAIGAEYDQELAMGFYHMFSGWIVFVAGFGALYLLAKLLRRFLEGGN